MVFHPGVLTLHQYQGIQSTGNHFTPAQAVYNMFKGSTSTVISTPLGVRNVGSTARNSWCSTAGLGDCNWK
jgi:hypothetical protein